MKMTQKKRPTIQQLNDFRTMLAAAKTDSDLEKLNRFIDEYDTFTQVYEEDGKKGVKNAAGQVLIPAEYDEIGYTFMDHLMPLAVPVVKDGKLAFVAMDGKGTMRSDFIYDDIEYTPECCYIVVKDGKKGIALHNGREVVPSEMDGVSLPFNGLGYFQKDGKYGFALIYEELLTGAFFEDFELGENEYLEVTRDGVKGYIDSEGVFTTDEDQKYFGAFFK